MALHRLSTFLLVLFSFTVQAQSDVTYKKEWQEIDSLIVKKNLTKTALDRVNVIYKRAQQQQQSAQLIKALIYRYSLESRITEDDPNKVFKAIQEELNASFDEAQKSILRTLLAKKMRDYFNRYRWQLYSRTTTINYSSNDIATWGAEDFRKAINLYFMQALVPAHQLERIPLEKYDAVLLEGSRKGSLFDLLSHEALEYFKSGDSYSTKPTAAFLLNDSRALGSLDVFIDTKFVTKDSSLQWKALELYQQLLTVHSHDADKNILYQLNIDRIEWVYRNAAFANKEEAYVRALQEAGSNTTVASTAQAWYLLARYHADKAATYAPFGDSTNRYEYVVARQIVIQALPLYKEVDNGVASMRNLLQEIGQKALHTETERVNLPEKDFRALVTYRNVDTLYARIIRIDNNDSIRNKQWLPDYWKNVVRLSTYKTFMQVLPTTNDYQQHTAEIKIDGLPVGSYAILCANGPAFNDTANKLGIQFFHVSGISYIKNKNDFFVLNRQNGQPLANVNITILSGAYNNKIQGITYKTYGTRSTDKNGYFRFDEKAQQGNFRYIFSKGRDRLDLQDNDYVIYENNAADNIDAVRFEKINTQVFFFTDRSIYRPGQSVSFKGIAVTKAYETKLSKLITNKDVDWVYLCDVNGKKLDSIRYSLNDYGSFSGKFLLPQNALTGNFSIVTKRYNQARTYFSVEEYKRPTFSISFDKPKGAYRLNDSVVINGSVKAYAGNNIGGAKVVYSVKRNSRFYIPMFRKIPSPNAGGREIAHAEIITDADGRFAIPFRALADDIKDRTGNPLFDFTVTADVTDINGETRSNNTQVIVGFASLLVNINTPAITEADSLKNIRISTTNLSSEKEAAQVQVKIYTLQAPPRLVRKRYWQRPDQFVMNKETFVRYFPTDEYEEESNYQTWATGILAMEGIINTGTADSLPIANGKLQPGYYKIEATTKDKYGEEVKTTSYIQLLNRSAQLPPVPTYQFNYIVRGSVEPGETADFITGSSATPLFVIRKTDRPVVKTNYAFITRKKGVEDISYTPDESDRGGVSITEAYVYDNRVYTNQYSITVPWSNKELQITYSSYRDKTEPGSIEKWTVTVQGNKDDKTPAELLTGMYDASLDQFKPHNWNEPQLWTMRYWQNMFTGTANFTLENGMENYLREQYQDVASDEPALLATEGEQLWDMGISTSKYSIPRILPDNELREVAVKGYAVQNKVAAAVPGIRIGEGVAQDAGGLASIPETLNQTAAPIQIRKNFNETAFFFPHLYADTSGKYSFSFTMPDALTQWKWMSLAHTKNFSLGSTVQTIVTQKTLMVQPNAPRFMREGDNMEFSTKIVNMSEQELTGQVTLELVDATTNTSVDGWFQNVFPVQYFTAGAGQSAAVKFPIQIPFSYNRPLTWRIVAKAGNFSDGEENTVPVVTNRMLVTESLPVFLPKDTTLSFRFDKLLNTTSETLTHESITVEYSTNPIWYAVQALPYLIDYPYECSEQTFNRFYANALASYIVGKHPRIKQIFDLWKADTTAFKSNLQKNEELKQIVLQETPWVIQAENEAQQKKNIAMLFDLARLGSQADQLIEKLQQLQLPNGSFPWFKGGSEDRYITNYILTGIGKLKRLGAMTPDIALRLKIVLTNAMKYADNKLAQDYQWLITNKVDLAKQQLSTSHVQYLYMRSFFGDVPQQSATAYQYFYNQGKTFWNKHNLYNEAMLALVYYRNNEKKFAANTILPAILENAVIDNSKGTMYWKDRQTCFWYASPIEHQAMMIQCLQELWQNEKTAGLDNKINSARTWLLLNKQTNNWRTTVATADACYVLLLNGTDWLNSDRKVTIELGNYTINSANENAQAGTGYFRKRIEAQSVKPEMGNITISVRSNDASTGTATVQPSWGSVYWQYFEDLDKITPAATPLSITRKLFVESNTDKGKVLTAIQEGDELKPGDKVLIRMEIRSDRDMEYVHLKDMRAASMEPINVLSSYKWQDGLGYYESTKDASTNFFISQMKKGTYVFEYPTFITHAGVFSAGLATIQCMYAPEFTAHSEGIKIRVKQ